MHELLLRVILGIDFGQGAQLRVGTKDQVHAGAGPFLLAGLAVAAFEQVFVFRNWLPGGAHIEQVDEEVIGQRTRTVGEDTVFGPAEVGTQDAHAAHQNRHLRRGQRQQLRLVDQQFLGGDRVFGLLVVAEAFCSRFEHREGCSIGLLC